jgi:hypothetical protein
MSIDSKPSDADPVWTPDRLERPWLTIVDRAAARPKARRPKMAEKDQASHASGRRSAERASSDDHRISHTRDRTLGEAGADPQELDTRDATDKKRRGPAKG